MTFNSNIGVDHFWHQWVNEEDEEEHESVFFNHILYKHKKIERLLR